MKIYSEDDVQMVSGNDEQLKQFHRISAAGGLVINDLGQILMIFRRSKWDLPKGKLEENEALELCAERETKEETGLKEIIFQKFLVTTYHTYTENKKQILKDTHWFQFKAPGDQQLTPQTEEDIAHAEWVDPLKLDDYTSNTFQLIRDVLKIAGYEVK